MAFWSTQRVRAEQQKSGNLVSNFDPKKVQQGAYELALSREVITTPSDVPRLDGVGKTLEIPSGQFAILYTEEKVTVPTNAIAFISIKARFKSDGLVNISGFHVDPGYSDRLKFSVYNAGNRPIFLEYERETFLIWFSDLDEETVEPYDKTHRHHGQNRITPEDRQRMSQASSSPASLDQRLKKVEQKIIWVFAACSAVAVCILLPSAKDWLDKRTRIDQPVAESRSPSPATTAVTEASIASQQMTLPATTPALTLEATPTPTAIASPKQ